MIDTTITELKAERSPFQIWASAMQVTLPRHSLERAALAFACGPTKDRIEALALIRAAYSCNVQEAQEILDGIKKCVR